MARRSLVSYISSGLDRARLARRILTWSYEFPPIGGGGAGVVRGLAAELVRQGHVVDVVTMGFRGLPAEETVDGIRVRRIDCARASESKCSAREALRYVMRVRPVVRAMLRENAYDFVHVHFIFPDGIVAWREVAPAGIPYIITAHGSDVPGYNPKRFFRLVHPLLTRLWRRVTRSAAAIVSPSRTLAELIDSVGPGVPVAVIPNGIDANRFRPAAKRDEILVATRLVERKGVQYLLEALAGSGVAWPATVVGSGEFQAELVRLNESLGGPARMAGWLSNDSAEFKALLERAAIYVLPSDFENFPVALLEAMAAGCAIVTTSGHGCEEVVGQAAAFVVPGSVDRERCVRELRETLQRLTTDRAACLALGSAARARLEDNFAWQAVAHRYVQLISRYSVVQR
jgi:glycosyltransferase involved in cell wall biosynthesis